MLNRRNVLAALLAAFPAPALAESCGSPAADFVRAVYRREVPRQVNRERMSEGEYNAAFSRPLRELVRKPIRPDIDLKAGAILNAFFGWGVLPGQDVTLNGVNGVSGIGGEPIVAVDLTVKGEPRRIFIHTTCENGDWKIGNISYDRGEDYLSFQRKLRGP